MKAIVIVANGWNAGWLGCYGNEWILTPHLDRLAAEAVVFDQHFAVHPSPDQYQRSTATGSYEIPGQTDHPPSIFQTLRRSGMWTVRLHDYRQTQPAAAEDWDATISIQRRDDEPPGKPLSRALAELLADLAARDRWLVWIETDRLIPPWSVSLDYFDKYVEDLTPAADGEPPQPWDEPPLGPRVLDEAQFDRLHGTFASVVTEWDADLGRWFDLFYKSGLADSALWVVTSGYGLALGEHDLIGIRGEHLHEEICHVPLIIRLPHTEQAGRRIAELTGSIDLLPTIAEVAGADLERPVDGKSLGALLRGSPSALRSYLCQAAGEQTALRTRDWALLFNQTGPRLFRKPEDRWEVYDTRMQHLEWAEHLRTTLQAFFQAGGARPPELKEYDEVASINS